MIGSRAKVILLSIFFLFESQAVSYARFSPIVEVVKRVSPAIVNIRTEEFKTQEKRDRDSIRRLFSQDELSDEDLEENIGSGVVIDPSGIVLTNEHLVSRAINIRVRFTDRGEYEASVIGCDPEFDVAVLKILNGGNFPYLRLKGRKDLNVGEGVVVIGNPYGLSSSVTTGVISALGRNLRVQNRVFANLIQTDAAINPGSSGGALIDLSGNLIGIVTAVIGEGRGIGFAIPAYDIEPMVAELLEPKGERPILGVFVEKSRDQSRFFLYVTRVIEGSPAEKYGIRRGDRIFEVNKKRIREGTKLKEINELFQAKGQVRILLEREGKELTVTIPLSEIQNFRPHPVSDKILKVRVSDLSLYGRLKYKVKERQGALINKVSKEGIGYSSDLRPGDVVIRINNKEVTSKADFERYMLQGLNRNYILYQVVRNNTVLLLPMKLQNLL